MNPLQTLAAPHPVKVTFPLETEEFWGQKGRAFSGRKGIVGREKMKTGCAKSAELRSPPILVP